MSEQEPRKHTSIPWKAIAKSMALVGGGYLAGHVGTGVTMHALGRTRAGSWFHGLPVHRRNQIRRRAGFITGMLGSAVAAALPHARDAHMDEELEKMHRKAASADGRIAQVYTAYALALEQG